MLHNKTFLTTLKHCGARLWLGGNNEVEKIRQNLHFASHSTATRLSLFYWNDDPQLFLAFFISCIFHWQIVSFYLCYIVDQKWISTLAKIVYVEKELKRVFEHTYVTRKERLSRGSPKGLSEEEGMTWPTLLRRLRNREMAYIYSRDLRKRRQRDTIKWHKYQFLQWDFLGDFLTTLYCISQLEIWTSAN